jgi:DNA-directed RNA polymerase subunit RPC12/RpoP
VMDAANDNYTPIYGPHPPTKKMAKALGTKYFFTGKECVHGHVAPYYAHGSCTACKEEYRRNNREKLRLESREWRAANPDKSAEYHRKKIESGYAKQYYERNREAQIAKAMAWTAANPEKHKASMAKYHATHREELLEKKRLKRLETLEEKKEKERLWRSQRRRELADKSRKWRQENPEKVRIIDRNKKIRRRGAEGTHTLEDIDRLFKAQRYKCAECGKSVRKSHHVDHITPLAKGGTNWATNLQILCPACNMEKHAADPIEWARRKGRLI